MSLGRISSPTSAVLTSNKGHLASLSTSSQTIGSNQRFTMAASTNTVTSNSSIRGRKRTASSRLPAKLKEPAAVARRNARERRRVKMVNDGFTRLRKHVPTDPKNKKLSKVKTLRLAIDYIKHLQQILNENASKPNHLIAAAYSLPNVGEDIDSVTAAWLQDGLARNHRDMDEDIFQSINPARLRKQF